MKKREVTILKPDYYDKFCCKGPDCRYTCCQKWHVDIEKKTYKRYRNLRQSKEWADRLKTYVLKNKNSDDDQRYAYIDMSRSSGKCPFLSEEGLCALQLELGKGVLSRICQEYPRIKNIFQGKTGTVVQYAFSFGCEKVIELLLAEEEGIGFVEETTAIEDRYWSGMIDAERIAAQPLAEHWQEIEYLAIDIIQDRRHPLEERLLFLGLFCQRLENGTTEEAAEIIRSFRRGYFGGDGFGELGELPQGDGEGQLSFCIKAFNELGVGGPLQQNGIIYRMLANLHVPMRITADVEVKANNGGNPSVSYRKAYVQYQIYMADKAHFWENLLVNEMIRRKFPFGNVEETPWDNYLWLCVLFVLLRFIVIGMLGEEGRLSHDDFIVTLATAGRTLSHSNDLKKACLVDWLKADDLTSLARVYTLLAPPKL